tara:strand:- start:535 stop:1719 length:1185 start_codon:yes stop_codon:yes gene_type:complete
MKEIRSDIVIVGGGLTGLTLAYGLSRLNLKIILLDKFNLLTLKNDNYDLRTTAISEGSRKFLEKIGLWKMLIKHVEPIKEIKVLDRESSKPLNFLNKNNLKNLGYIVRNSIIKKNLLNLINKNKNIKLLNNYVLQNIKYSEDKVVCVSKKNKIYSKLLIATDGKKSKVRGLMETPCFKKNYKQKALVVNFDHSIDHESKAYELFFSNGPLAILPMKKYKKNLYSSSVIWSEKKDFIDNLYKLNRSFLLKILEEKIFKFVGNIDKIIDVQSFNLSAHINSSFFEERVMYVGDSAHSIHPIAGQGWNVGVRDIQKCIDVIENGLSLGLDLGSFNVCKRYNDYTYCDAYSLFEITDKLNSVFTNDNFVIKSIRKKGFKIINNNKKLKNFITDFAMGV